VACPDKIFLLRFGMEEQVKVEKLSTKAEHDNDSGGNIPKGKGIPCRERTSAGFGPRGVQLST
jgi:hypothetical protein